MTGVSWTWRLEDAEGKVVTGPASPPHPTQSDAETWIGETWRDLAAAGVAQVSLFEDGRLEYGPMSLAEA